MMIRRFLRRAPRPSLSATLALGVLVWAGGCKKETASDNTGPASQGQLTIAVIPKGTMHEFWRSVEAGANDAGKELGVKILWKGSPKEDQRDEQISIVESFVSDRVSGIVLAPLDNVALVSPVHDAVEKKIPVVIIDSPLKGEAGKDFVSLVATDNRKGGYAAGEELAKALGAGPKKVVLLRYAVGSASTDERETGFLDAISKHPDLTVISKDQYAGASIDTAQTAAENLLDKLQAADGVFTPNESSSLGMLNVLRDHHLLGKIKFVAFDTPKPLIDGVRSGDIAAVVGQNPRNMGYLGVKTVVQQIRGEKVPPAVDTGSAVITKANVDDPAIKKLLGQ